MDLEPKINKVYNPYFSDTHKYAVLYGSACAGRTHAAIQKHVIRCMTETGINGSQFRHTIYAFVKERYSLRPLYEHFKLVCEDMQIRDHVYFNDTCMELHFKNGAKILCLSFDYTVRSGATSIFVDQLYDFTENEFLYVECRLNHVGDYYRQITVTFNPLNVEPDWIKNRFYTNVDKGNTFTLNTSFRDNEYLDDEYKHRIENTSIEDANHYNAYILGQYK